MPPTPATSDMLTEMSACAFRLGKVFAAEAEAAQDWASRRELFQLFDRCFFSVRVAIALQLRLGRTSPPPVESEREEPEIERAERAEVERPERLERDDAGVEPERDRDREADRERASLPLLLTTLQGVAAGAAARPGPEPAALPTLRELLARLGAGPAPQAALGLMTKPPAAPLRARLAMSSSAFSRGDATTLLAKPRATLRVPRATGPPRSP